MATEAQIRANRLNAQKSTGPRTAEGKAVVAQNAIRHGLWARQAVVMGEDVGEFESCRDEMLAELAPEGPMESALAQRAVGLAWRLRRAERLQNEAFDALCAKDTTSPLARFAQRFRASEPPSVDSDEPGPDLTCGRVVVRDFGNARVLDRLLMYERRLEHSLYKTLTELQRLRLLRELNPPEEPSCEHRHTETFGPSPNADQKPQPDCAKQTQSASTVPTPKSFADKNIDEKRANEPSPKQTQTNPTSPASSPGRRQPSRPERDPEARPGGFQSAKRAVYSGPRRSGPRQSIRPVRSEVSDSAGKEPS